jgi:DNA gyrase subunit A
MGSVKRRIRFDLNKKKDLLHLLLGLKKILLDIDKAIKIIRETEEEKAVIPRLMQGFAIDQTQAEYIAEIKLRNLNKEYILNRISEVERLQEEIVTLQETYESEDKIREIIQEELAKVAEKYGKPRRTILIGEDQVEEITVEHLIEDYNLKLFLTKENYLKKVALTSLRSNPEHKLKDEDFFVQEIESKNKADLLLFSNKHIVYKVKIYDLPDCKASSLGEYLPNLLELEEDERIIYLVATDDYRGNILFAFENGKMAKIDLQSYATKTNRKKLANAYSDLSPLVKILNLPEDRELVAISSINKVLVFDTTNINAKTTRDSQGVQVLKGKKDSKLVALKELEEVTFTDPDYYRTKNIPAIGCYLKEEDMINPQTTLDLE